MNTSSGSFRYIFAILIWPILILIFSQQQLWTLLLQPFASVDQSVLYEQNTLLGLFVAHMWIVLKSMFLILLVAIPLAIFVTRPVGSAFKPLVQNISTMSQTLPPMAALFLFLPLLGFGSNVVVFSMFLFGLMPTLQAALTGMGAVDQQTKSAAMGIGYSPTQVLFKVEIPLALASILAGLRTSLLLIIATTALAPMVGAESLGSPIIVGFSINSTSQILQGAIVVALLSICIDFSLRTLANYLTRWRHVSKTQAC